MNVILRTLCGCMRMACIPPGDSFVVAIAPPFKPFHDNEARELAYDLTKIRTRRFRWRGETQGDIQVWEEVWE